jgi:hypothetical protein
MDAGVNEDAMGAFLDPVDNILVTKDGGAPSKVGRQRTERVAERFGSTDGDESRREWEQIGGHGQAASNMQGCIGAVDRVLKEHRDTRRPIFEQGN